MMDAEPDVDVDVLVQLIGACPASLSNFRHLFLILSRWISFSSGTAADMMERLMAHNDRIPLSPCARTLSSKLHEFVPLTC